MEVTDTRQSMCSLEYLTAFCTANIRLTFFFQTDIIFDIFRYYNSFSMTLLAVLFLATACSALSVNNLVDIVIAVKQYFRSGCVCLLHDRGNGKFWQSHFVTKIFFLFSVHFIIDTLIVYSDKYSLINTEDQNRNYISATNFNQSAF
jgi:hypothetical protein